MPDEAALRRLEDREAIRDLKARYFRLLDAKDWAGYRDVFTEDAHFDVQSFAEIDGVDDFIALVRETLDGTTTVHHGHMGEITLTSDTEAEGTWSLADYVEWDSDDDRRGIQGYGRYQEVYRKQNGTWRIASLRLRYTRIDPLPRQRLPKTVLAGRAPVA
jgi:hypothetical protein